MTIPMPPRGSPTHYVFAGAYTVIGGLMSMLALTHDPARDPSGRGADLEQAMGWMLDRFGPEPVVALCALLAVAGASVHLYLADAE